MSEITKASEVFKDSQWRKKLMDFNYYPESLEEKNKVIVGMLNEPEKAFKPFFRTIADEGTYVEFYDPILPIFAPAYIAPNSIASTYIFSMIKEHEVWPGYVWGDLIVAPEYADIYETELVTAYLTNVQYNDPLSFIQSIIGYPMFSPIFGVIKQILEE